MISVNDPQANATKRIAVFAKDFVTFDSGDIYYREANKADLSIGQRLLADRGMNVLPNYGIIVTYRGVIAYSVFFPVSLYPASIRRQNNVVTSSF